MPIKKKYLITLMLASVVTFTALTSMKPEEEGFKNLKVLPKTLSHDQLENVMHVWSGSLGVHCDFCHARNEDGKGLNFVSDAKPEKKMAREMYLMMNKINSKYFEAKKDSLGMMMTSGVNCYSCHRGTSHPEVKLPEMRMGPPPGGPGGPPTGGQGPGGPPPGGPGAPSKQN